MATRKKTKKTARRTKRTVRAPAPRVAASRAPAPRMAARDSEPDQHAADELVLYIQNTSELSPDGPSGQGRSILLNMLRKWRKGTYNPELAVKQFEWLTETGAKQYNKEFGSDGRWHEMFNKATRREAARQLEAYFRAEADLGNYDRIDVRPGARETVAEAPRMRQPALAERGRMRQSPRRVYEPRSMEASRIDELRAMLPRGYSVETYSPGDGVTRYRFFENAPPKQDYFGPDSGIHTALGYKAAVTFAQGGAARPRRAREVNEAPRGRWDGSDANERAYNSVHNGLVNIIIDGPNARSPEILKKAERVLVDLNSQTPPKRSWSGHDVRINQLRRMIHAAEEVMSGRREVRDAWRHLALIMANTREQRELPSADDIDWEAWVDRERHRYAKRGYDPDDVDWEWEVEKEKTILEKQLRRKYSVAETPGRTSNFKKGDRVMWSDTFLRRGREIDPKWYSLRKNERGTVDCDGDVIVLWDGEHDTSVHPPVRLDHASNRMLESPRRHVDDYIAVDRRGRKLGGPFKSYSDADDAAGTAGVVKFVPAKRMSEARRPDRAALARASGLPENATMAELHDWIFSRTGVAIDDSEGPLRVDDYWAEVASIIEAAAPYREVPPGSKKRRRSH